MSQLPDQTDLWDKKHAKGEHEEFANEPSTLGKITAKYLKPNSTILEIGCGVGRDAKMFAEQGHHVIATDLSPVVINRNQQEAQYPNVEYRVLDILKPLPFDAEEFDAVFANLSLHYFLDADTKKIIADIARVLKPGGVLAFSAKSVNDFHKGNGEEVEKNIFVSEKGHVRHLFSPEYIKEILGNNFENEYLEELVEEYSGQTSHILLCIARKVGKNWGEL